MKTPKMILLLAICFLATSSGVVRAEEDSAEGLPPEYAKNYLIARSTISPIDQKFALIYPNAAFSKSKEAKDLVVALQPFKVLAALPTDHPYVEDKSERDVSADWRDDSSAALIMFHTEWRATDVFLVEFSGDKVTRITNLLEKTRELIRPKFRSAQPKPKPYNNADGFVFEIEEGGPCQFDEKGVVAVYVKATNDPDAVSKRSWRVLVKAMWDIGQAKFISQKIRRIAPGENVGG